MSWEMYYEKNKGRPVRDLYEQAIQYASSSAAVAIDLGCGIGIEVLDLLKRNFEVYAVDQQPLAIEALRAQAQGYEEKLHTEICYVEYLDPWPQVDFLLAYHSLPFCFPAHFQEVVDKAVASISKAGIFAVSFFGPEDQWVQEKKVVGITEQAIKDKLRDFEILHFEEIKKIGPTALQGDKMWHVFEVIARKS